MLIYTLPPLLININYINTMFCNFLAGQQGNAPSPAKSNISDKPTNKLSPIQSSYNQAQALQRMLPSAVMPSVLQNQQQLISLNNAASSLMQQTSGTASSSSGKRKASNPQKFTRFREVASASPVEPPKPAAFMSNSVANALQFMPSLLSTMMQQRQLQENLARQDPEVCQRNLNFFSLMIFFLYFPIL